MGSKLTSNPWNLWILGMVSSFGFATLRWMRLDLCSARKEQKSDLYQPPKKPVHIGSLLAAKSFTTSFNQCKNHTFAKVLIQHFTPYQNAQPQGNSEDSQYDDNDPPVIEHLKKKQTNSSKKCRSSQWVTRFSRERSWKNHDPTVGPWLVTDLYLFSASPRDGLVFWGSSWMRGQQVSNLWRSILNMPMIILLWSMYWCTCNTSHCRGISISIYIYIHKYITVTSRGIGAWKDDC